MLSPPCCVSTRQQLGDHLFNGPLGACAVQPPGGCRVSIAHPDECSQRLGISRVLRQERGDNTLAVKVPPGHLYHDQPAPVGREAREGAKDVQRTPGHPLWLAVSQHATDEAAMYLARCLPYSTGPSYNGDDRTNNTNRIFHIIDDCTNIHVYSCLPSIGPVSC